MLYRNCELFASREHGSAVCGDAILIPYSAVFDKQAEINISGRFLRVTRWRKACSFRRFLWRASVLLHFWRFASDGDPSVTVQGGVRKLFWATH
jgi:hypothetical protein